MSDVSMMPDWEFENFPTSEPKKMGRLALIMAMQAALRTGMETLM